MMKNTLMFVLMGVILIAVIGLPFLAVRSVQPKVIVKIVEPISIVKVIPEVLYGVVHIRCPQWQGSGFVISEHLIATARHVVEEVEDFEITFNDDTVRYATKAISSVDHDIAFIWVDESMPAIVKLGSIKECLLGQTVFAIGSPYGKVNYNSVTLGIISGLNRDYDELNDSMYGSVDYGWDVAFQTDAPGHPGNSGGPIFTLDGKVRGILVGGFSPSLIIAMPVDLFLEDIEMIELMFLQDEYYHEEKPEYTYDSYYNYDEDNEYYRK
jgi:S1-C subfamily serine protease